jgi:signal transduction histidine kinase
MAPLFMDHIVFEARNRLLYLIERQKAEIILPEEWPVAMGYAPWIEEVWVNYISNAIKYGGSPPRVELGGIKEDDGVVRFWARDNGKGISSGDQESLFAPFTRLQQVRARGHGLGLSIVQRIIQKLGGDVGVTSGEGDGSIFYFTLQEAP